MPPSPAEEPVRRAGTVDETALAELLARAWAAADASGAVDPAAARQRAAKILEGAETWVVGFEQLRGVLVLDDDRISELWVDPALQGQGIGSRLVALAKLRRPAGVTVVPDEASDRLRAFFAAHDFEGASSGAGMLRWQP